MYYILLPVSVDRQNVLRKLASQGINAVFHYVPLHSSPAGIRYGRVHGTLKQTITQSERLIRLPLWIGLTTQQQDWIVEVLGAIVPELI
jgi:dTDP-4-amino-4,6-dideoxygalactose transaminase